MAEPLGEQALEVGDPRRGGRVGRHRAAAPGGLLLGPDRAAEVLRHAEELVRGGHDVAGGVHAVPGHGGDLVHGHRDLLGGRLLALDGLGDVLGRPGGLRGDLPRLFRRQHGAPARARDVLGEALDLLDRAHHLLGQALHLGGDEGEAAPGLAGFRALQRGVQGEQVAAVGDLLHQHQDLPDVGGVRGQLPDAAPDDLRALLGDLRARQHVGPHLPQVLGGPQDPGEGLARLLHRRRRFGGAGLLLLGGGEERLGHLLEPAGHLGDGPGEGAREEEGHPQREDAEHGGERPHPQEQPPDRGERLRGVHLPDQAVADPEELERAPRDQALDAAVVVGEADAGVPGQGLADRQAVDRPAEHAAPDVEPGVAPHHAVGAHEVGLDRGAVRRRRGEQEVQGFRGNLHRDRADRPPAHPDRHGHERRRLAEGRGVEFEVPGEKVVLDLGLQGPAGDPGEVRAGERALPHARPEVHLLGVGVHHPPRFLVHEEEVPELQLPDHLGQVRLDPGVDLPVRGRDPARAEEEPLRAQRVGVLDQEHQLGRLGGRVRRHQAPGVHLRPQDGGDLRADVRGVELGESPDRLVPPADRLRVGGPLRRPAEVLGQPGEGRRERPERLAHQRRGREDPHAGLEPVHPGLDLAGPLVPPLDQGGLDRRREGAPREQVGEHRGGEERHEPHQEDRHREPGPERDAAAGGRGGVGHGVSSRETAKYRGGPGRSRTPRTARGDREREPQARSKALPWESDSCLAGGAVPRQARGPGTGSTSQDQGTRKERALMSCRGGCAAEPRHAPPHPPPGLVPALGRAMLRG